MAASTVPVIFTSPTWQMNGVNVFTANLARGLEARGRPTLIALTDPIKEEPIPMDRPEDLELLELDLRPGDPLNRRWRLLRSMLEQHRPCVYVPNYDWHTSCVCPQLPNDVGIIGIVHSDDPRHYEHLDRLGDTWNAVVAVSRTIGDRIRATRPEAASRLHVIPIGVKLPDVRSPRSPNRRRLRVVYSGLLNRFQKRIFDVVEVARELDHRKVAFSLTFCGGGDDEDNLRQATSDLVEREMVRFTGILDHHALSSELSHSDIFLLTSEFEGLPNALLEAMAHGLVPIVSRIESGIPEVVRDGWNGYTAPVGDIERFAERICHLDEDRECLATMAERAYSSIADGPFNLERMIDSYDALIQLVADQVAAGSFKRARGRVRPPRDVGPLWRHMMPQWLRLVWRWAKSSTRGASI